MQLILKPLFRSFLITIPAFLLISCQNYEKDAHEILGIPHAEVLDVESADVPSSPGEGCTLVVYCLSAQTVNDFVLHSTKRLPVKRENGVTWGKIDWIKGPLHDSTYKSLLDFCLNVESGNDFVDNTLPKIQKWLQKPNTYYAFYYKPDRDNTEDADLFFLDVQEGKLYTFDISI
jgi:hypothetical protein